MPAYSKWIDVHPLSTATAQKTIEKIRESITTHGIPDTIVSDSGSYLLWWMPAYSKWIDVHPLSTATAQKTIEKSRESITTHGIPDTIVSDSGSCFTSGESVLLHSKWNPVHPSGTLPPFVQRPCRARSAEGERRSSKDEDRYFH